MAHFKENFIYPLIEAKTSLLYLRFIVDIFMSWTKSEEFQLIEFFNVKPYKQKGYVQQQISLANIQGIFYSNL